MLPELGHYALILALCLALVQGSVPLIGAQRGISNWMALARPLAWAQFAVLLLSFAILAHAFVSNDFSVAYAARHSNSLLPAIYRFSAVWGGHEGSLLLWALLLAGWSAAVGLFSRRLPLAMVARVLGVMGLVSVGFLAFLILTSNPFGRLWPIPADGRDLNPLLQDPGLVLHPPMLYMGYVGFSVAFAFAIAALLGGKLDATWARWSRPWTTVAWVFMTLGIALGSWWAYYELGWGGWWFWDPVENASFMPWLVGTALIHSLAVAEKRSAFKNWTVLLAIFTFSLSLLGTFLVRSGVLTSVHAFATDPQRGLFILMQLAVVVGASLLVYAWRAPQVKSTGHFDLISRETMLLGNNVLLVVATASVLLGTLYPLIVDALGAGKISVGPPYFNTVFVPLMIPLAFMIGVGPLTRWKGDQLGRLQRMVRLALAASIAGGVLLPWLLFRSWEPMVILGCALAVWIAATAVLDLRNRLHHASSLGQGLRRQGRSFWGMVLAHLGVAVTIVGITFSSYFSQEHDVRLAPGETYVMGEHSFVFEQLSEHDGPNYTASRATLRVEKAGRAVATLHTEKRLYTVTGMPMTEAGIDWGLTRDLYVALGEPLGDGAWAVRLYHKPYVRWIWLGALLMALGGLLAAADRRYRLVRRTVPQTAAASVENHA
ncbi:heme lyase CcmF/NrfE family subunit [Sulfurivermis fontis]|uniref:heme lyase CcmF/NrfE family subunit n=1 Tax=Sulfurivermis fontis TaxID=1972068 RepID=UPI000FDCD2E6|nr:heme lyase CcmF/NrfE family subunit [Sulfurivermis fontis]